MQDSPDADAILAEVEAALKAGIPEGLQQRIAANAVALVRRELSLAGDWAEDERTRLVLILERDGSLAELNAAFADAIRTRRLGAESPGVISHLWRTTIEKMRVDQPAYPAFAAWHGANQKNGTEQ